MKKQKMIILITAASLFFTGCSSNVKDGVALLEEKKYENAIVAFEEQVDIGKKTEEAYYGLGIAYFELEEYEKSVTAFEKSIEQGISESAILYSFLGAGYIEEERYADALNAYEKALQDEKCDEELKQEILYNLISVYENMADWDKAKSQLEEYITLYPEDTRVEKEAIFLETR